MLTCLNLLLFEEQGAHVSSKDHGAIAKGRGSWVLAPCSVLYALVVASHVETLGVSGPSGWI